jgi:hypothetical protein
VTSDKEKLKVERWKRGRVTSDKGQVTSLPACGAGDKGQAKTKSEKLKTKSGNEYKVVSCDCCQLWVIEDFVFSKTIRAFTSFIRYKVGRRTIPRCAFA